MKFNLTLILLLAVLLFLIPVLKIQRTDSTHLPPKLEPTVQTGTSSPPPQDAEDAPLPSISPSEPTVLPSFSLQNSNGSFKILNTSTGKVNKISYEDYVKGAICAEMPPSFHLEALKAQGVAALTYALYNKNMNEQSPNPALKGADFAADPSNWKGYVTEAQAKERFGENFTLYWGKICEAAQSVDHVAMVYDSQPIIAAYHSTSSGITEYAQNVWEQEMPYLQAVESEGDLLAPDYQISATFSPAEIKEMVTAAYSDIVLQDDPSEWFEVTERSDGGYITTIAVGDTPIHGKELRSLLKLRSSNFDIDYNNSTFTFTTYGYGHGVGLSQYGADFMARQGSSFEEILHHYYTDISLVSIKD